VSAYAEVVSTDTVAQAAGAEAASSHAQERVGALATPDANGRDRPEP
jgi:hypothetical protein